MFKESTMGEVRERLMHVDTCVNQGPRFLQVSCYRKMLLSLVLIGITSRAQAQISVDQESVAISASAQQQITALVSNARVQDALAHILTIKAQLRSNLIELTEIPAPTLGEALRGHRFAKLLRESGLTDVVIDEVGNVIGRRLGRTGTRVVAYTAHLDTVFPAQTDVTVRIKGDTLFAPGIGDNTRGLVVLLGVLGAIQQAKIETDADILFIGNVGEEGLGDLRGVKHLFRKGGPQIDAMIAIDGGSTGRIVYGGVGSQRYRITFAGPGGHSWGAFGTVNPHHALGRALVKFIQGATVITSSGEKSSFSVGRIGGGTSINSIPFESWMEVDMRSGLKSKLDELDATLKRAVQHALLAENTARSKGPALTADIKSVGTRPVASGDRNSRLVQYAAAAMGKFAVMPLLRVSSTDANMPISIGVPAITMSRGGIGKDSHSLDESWQDKDSHLAIQIGLLTLLAEADTK